MYCVDMDRHGAHFWENRFSFPLGNTTSPDGTNGKGWGCKDGLMAGLWACGALGCSRTESKTRAPEDLGRGKLSP